MLLKPPDSAQANAVTPGGIDWRTAKAPTRMGRSLFCPKRRMVGIVIIHVMHDAFEVLVADETQQGITLGIATLACRP